MLDEFGVDERVHSDNKPHKLEAIPWMTKKRKSNADSDNDYEEEKEPPSKRSPPKRQSPKLQAPATDVQPTRFSTSTTSSNSGLDNKDHITSTINPDPKKTDNLPGKVIIFWSTISKC